MATNWNAILSNTNNLTDVLAILKKVLAVLEVKADVTTIGEALAHIEQLNIDIGSAVESVDTALEKLQLEADDVIAQGFYKSYATEVLLKSDTPNIAEMRARADDTRKIWRWNRTSAEGIVPVTGAWVDTGLSELDLAKENTKDLISQIATRGGAAEKLYEFRDSEDQLAVAFESDGNIITPKANLHKISETANKTSESLNAFKSSGGGLSNLYEFRDSADDLAVVMKSDGNIITPEADLYDIAEKTNTLFSDKDQIRLTSNTVERGNTQNLYEFQDAVGLDAVSITKEANIQFNGGATLTRTALNTAENTRNVFSKEHASNEYVSLNMQRLLLSNVSNLSPFIGSFKQKFTIKNPSDFLNLKIAQTPAISIDTPYIAKDLMPYSSQVVHPYICEFTKTVHGWKYILVITPFHNTHDLMENPCIYGSNDLKSFELLQGFEQPIAIAKPLDQYNYNSDPCAVFDHQTGEFVCLYRNSVQTDDNLSIQYSTLHTRRTKDFVRWSEIRDIDIDDGDLSPTLVFDTSKNKWLMFSGNNEFCVRESGRIEGPWSAPVAISTPFVSWHQEVKYCGNHFVGIFNDLERRAEGGEGDMYFGISSDGLTWQFSESIFAGSFVGPYKPSISHEFVDASNIRFNIVWTSSDRNANFSDRWRLYSAKTQAIEVI